MQTRSAAEFEPDTKAVKGVQKVETVLYKIHQGIGIGRGRSEGQRPHQDRRNIDPNPENPLLHIGCGHKQLTENVAHCRESVRKDGKRKYLHFSPAPAKLQKHKIDNNQGSEKAKGIV